MDLKITKYKRLISFIPLLLASLTLFIASHQEGVPFDTSIFIFQDKIMHFFAYFIYGITIQLFLLSFDISNRKYIILTIIIGSIFGLSDEIHQYFIANRSTEFFDWVADTLGCASSLILKKYVFQAHNYLFTHNHKTKYS
jgi:VanZ family protein